MYFKNIFTYFIKNFKQAKISITFSCLKQLVNVVMLIVMCFLIYVGVGVRSQKFSVLCDASQNELNLRGGIF